jgi:hypothetical protein
MHVCITFFFGFRTATFLRPTRHFQDQSFFVLPTWYKIIEKTENTSSSSSSHDHHHSKDTKTHGFLLNGTTALNSITNDMYLHDPSTDTWTTLWLTTNNDSGMTPMTMLPTLALSFRLLDPIPMVTSYLILGIPRPILDLVHRSTRRFWPIGENSTRAHSNGDDWRTFQVMLVDTPP